MSWDEVPPTGEEDDILTIEVFGKRPGGGGGGGNIGTSMKMAAWMAQGILKGGGTILVVVGGVSMIVGGYTAWTGGGAGVFVGGAAAAGVGAGAYWVGSLLDQIVRDPPQPNYKRTVYLRPGALSLGPYADEPGSPIGRTFHHLSHLSVLGPNMLDALERKGGADLAGDKAWSDGWNDALTSLYGLSMARLLGLSRAFSDLADLQMPDISISAADMAKGLAMLQTSAGKAQMDSAMKDMGIQPEIVSAAQDWIKTAKPEQFHIPVNPAETLRMMSRNLGKAAETALAAY